MSDYQRSDDFLYRACEENSEAMKSLAPDFNKIEQEVRLKYRQGGSKKRRTLLLRIAAASIATILVLNAFLLFSEAGPVKAYRAEVRRLFYNLFNDHTYIQSEDMIVRTANEISKVQKLVPFTIPVPGWLPPEYQFDYVTMTDDGYDIYYVDIHYKSADDALLVSITNDTTISSTRPSPGEGSFEHEVFDGMDIYTAFIERNGRWMCMYFNKQGLYMHISGAIDKQSLYKIIESMD